MKIKNTIISGIIAVTQSKWMPTLMMMAIFAGGLGVDGCGSHPH